MNIKKIKYTGGKVSLEWEKLFTKDGKIDRDDFTLKCSEPAEASFYTTLASLKEDVIALCELPETFTEGLKVTGVSLSWTEDVWGVVISASKTLKKSNAPFNINTPWKASRADTDGQGSHLNPGTVKRIELLMEKAEDYIGGKRGQLDAFDQDKSEN